MLKNAPAGTTMLQRTSDRSRPFKTYNPNPVEFDAQGNPQPQGLGQNQNQGLQQDQLSSQALFDLDDASLLSLLGQQGQGDSMNPNMMRGPGGMTSQGMSLGGAGNGMQSHNSMASSSQANMQMTSMSSPQVSSTLSIPSTSGGPSASEMFGSSFLAGLGSQDQDINISNFLTGMPPGLSMQHGGMGQQGGMLSQQAGGMVHGGRDMQQSHRGMGQMGGNGSQMSSMPYSTDMNIPSYTPLKVEKQDDIFSSPPGTSGSSSKGGEGNGNGNSISSPESPANTSASAPDSPAKSVTSQNDGDSGMEGDGSKSSKKRQHIVPDEQKDEAYWEKRRKNNESAKRSREARRLKEEQIAMRVVVLEQENLALKTEIGILKNEVDNLRHMLYNTPPPPPNHIPQ